MSEKIDEIIEQKEIKEKGLEKKRKDHRDRYYYLKSLGVCPCCGKNDAFHGHVFCPSCMEKQQNRDRARYHQLSAEEKKAKNIMSRENKKKRYYRRKAEGICVSCGKKKATNGLRCLECYVKQKKSDHRRAQQKKIEKGGDPRDIRTQKGLCRFCEEPAVPGQRLCEKHYQGAVESMRNARKFSHYWQRDNQIAFMKRKKAPITLRKVQNGGLSQSRGE